MLTLPSLPSGRATLSLPSLALAPLLLAYYQNNRDHLAPWEPTRPAEFYTLADTDQRLAADVEAQRSGRGLKLLAQSTADGRIVAVCNFNNIVRGAFQACHLGYSVARSFQGQGLMSEVVSAGLDVVFSELLLHRVMANYVPENTRSARLLERLGFEIEGRAKAYLRINGEWRDHILTSKLSPNKDLR